MPRIKNNYDMFAARGDPWDAPEHARMPARSSSGVLRLPIHARTLTLKPLTKASNAATKVNHDDIENHSLDLDAYLLAGRALPFPTRINKERNHAVKPMSEGKLSTSGMDSRKAISMRYFLTQKKAQHLIKVK